MQKRRVKCIVSFLVSAVFFIASASVYAAKIQQKQDLPIYMARGKQGRFI